MISLLIFKTMTKDKLLAFFFVIFPIFNIYATGLPGLSVAEFLFLVLYIINLKKQRFVEFKQFYIYTVFSTLISLLLFRNTLFSAIYEEISLMLTILILNFLICTVDRQLFTIYYLKVTDIILGFFIFQIIEMNLLGVITPGVLPIPLASGFDTSDLQSMLTNSDRPSSFFTEPAHFAGFLLVSLILLGFKSEKRKKEKIKIVLIITSIILSQSAIGITGVMVTVCYLAYCNIIWFKRHRIVTMALVTIGVAIVLAGGYITMSLLEEGIFRRFLEISSNTESGVHGYSSYIRVARGYIPFLESPFFQQIFGNGLGSLDTIISNNPHSEYLLVTDFLPKWVNTMQSILIYTGIVGLAIFMMKYKSLFKQADSMGRAALLSSFCLFFGNDGFLSFFFIVACFISKKRAYPKR